MRRALTIILLQFATLAICSAAEPPKTVEPINAATGADSSINPTDPVAIQPPTGKLPHALISLKSETGHFSQYAFLVDKKARTLTVWQNAGDVPKLVGAWPTDIGRRDGDKLVQGDHRTPEGVYFMQTMMDGRKVNFDEYGVRIFTLDYPNYFDRLERKTGNGIWFHAIPDSKSLLRGSRGCVVVRNVVIEELSRFIELKRTPMIIVDSVEYMDPDKWRDLKAALTGWIEKWRVSWGSKDIENYMAHYSDKFRSNGMKKERWREYKKNLAGRYEFIDVQLKDIQVFNQGPKIVFRFLQSYKSDQKEDYGTKVIYTLREGDHFQIVGESWEPIRHPVAFAK